MATSAKATVPATANTRCKPMIPLKDFQKGFDRGHSGCGAVVASGPIDEHGSHSDTVGYDGFINQTSTHRCGNTDYIEVSRNDLVGCESDATWGSECDCGSDDA